jgi:hypothetical protein
MKQLETEAIFLRWPFNDLASVQKNCSNPMVTLKEINVGKVTIILKTNPQYQCYASLNQDLVKQWCFIDGPCKWVQSNSSEFFPRFHDKNFGD